MKNKSPHITKPHRDQLRMLLERCYEVGFMASGEGWNGEYPFRNQDVKPIYKTEFIRARDCAIDAIIKDV